MEIPVVVGVAALALLVLIRQFAARRVVARQGRFVWLFFMPALLGGVVMLWASIQLILSAPLVGLALATAGVIYLAVLVRFLTRLSRSVTSAGPQDDVASAMIAPLADYMGTIMGVPLIVGLVAMLGLIIWGIGHAAR